MILHKFLQSSRLSFLCCLLAHEIPLAHQSLSSSKTENVWNCSHSSGMWASKKTNPSPPYHTLCWIAASQVGDKVIMGASPQLGSVGFWAISVSSNSCDRVSAPLPWLPTCCRLTVRASRQTLVIHQCSPRQFPGCLWVLSGSNQG